MLEYKVAQFPQIVFQKVAKAAYLKILFFSK